MKSLCIKDVPENLAVKIKVTAALRKMSVRELVIAALGAYLQNGGKK